VAGEARPLSSNQVLRNNKGQVRTKKSEGGLYAVRPRQTEKGGAAGAAWVWLCFGLGFAHVAVVAMHAGV
jgi:hypothetical protein